MLDHSVWNTEEITHQLINPGTETLGGIPVFKGTSVPIRNLFTYLKAGRTIAEFLADFPTVQPDQPAAVLELVRHLVFTEEELDKP